MITYIIGIVGNILFGFKSFFQVFECYRTKTTKGISIAMLITDFMGNLCCAFFIFNTTGFTLWPQFVNYFFATFWLIILLLMKCKYKQ